jgi:hypothetical protein
MGATSEVVSAGINNYYRTCLATSFSPRHKALKELGYVNPFTGTHKAGNHAFRRFRNTYLRNYAECPEGLYKYWMGHAGKDMSDLYDKIKEDVAFRRKWAERCGFGFQLPSVVPNVPKCTEKTEVPIAA